MTATHGSRLDHTIGLEGLLAVSLRSGTMRLRAVDGDAVRIRDASGHDLQAAFSIEVGPESVSLRANRGFDLAGLLASGGGADLEIDVPRRATVVLDGTSTEIEADGLAGEQRYRTVSGDIALRAVSGRIRIEAISGDIDITAGGEASLAAHTVSGDLDLRAATLTAIEVATTSGDLKVAGRLAGPGPFRVETVSGDGLLAPVGDLRIEMTTVTGDLRSEIGGTSGGGRGRRSLVVGAHGPLVSFRSMSGDLRIVRAMPVTEDDVAPPAAETAHGAEPVAAAPAAIAGAAPGTLQAEPVRQPVAVGRDDTERIPITFTPPAAPAPAEPPAGDAGEDGRVAILRALERGEIDVTEAGRRLTSLDEDGARAGFPAAPDDGALDG
jgi:hypothetical protein